MTQAKKSFLVAALMGALIQVTGAQQNITAANCANPAGFTNCHQQAMHVSLVCSANAGSNADAQLVCACKLTLAEISCALESCWNVVYGCEYQSLAFFWDAYCLGTLGDIPFFPPPENAPGGCSCNLGHVIGNYTNVENSYTPCVQAGNGVLACGCCQQGGLITSVYSLCSNDNPFPLGLSYAEEALSAADSNPSVCAPYFKQYDCVKDLGFPRIGALPYLTAIPSTTGTLNPSTTGGSITTPLCGSACTLTAGGSSTTIIPFKASTASNSAIKGSSSQLSSQSPSSTATSSSGTRRTSRAYGLLCSHLFVVYTIAYLI